MSKPYHFDLEHALAAWRRSLTHHRAFSADDLDELEQHLRDEVAARVAEGLPEEAAYRRALSEMGGLPEAESEYGKVYWGKRRRRGEVFDELRWRLSMLRNYFLVAVRTMRRQAGYSALNIAGLAVGMASCLLLTCYIYDEARYDTFHEHADRIYRITTRELASGGPEHAHTFPAAGPVLARELPEVAQATRVLRGGFGNHTAFRVGDRTITDPEFLYVDSTFFDVFTVSFLEGDRTGALARPNTAVITRAAARTFFGSESPLGRTFTVPHTNPTLAFEVVGVVERFPSHAHVHFDYLLSLETWNQGRTVGYFDNNWRVLNGYTYVLLRDDHAAASLASKLPALVEARTGTEIPDRFRVALQAQPLTDIHLHSRLQGELEPNGDVRNVYILGAIAVFLLLIAGINFINLGTARAGRRATEVGVRKVVGASRGQLVRQFLSESMLLACLALTIALALSVLSLPAFNSLTGKALTPAALLTERTPLLSLLGIMLLIGLVAGSYPAFLLSAFRPSRVLKGSPREYGRRGTIRKALVVTQFALSIGLMIATAVIYRQLSFMQNTRLGFDKEHVLVLDHRFQREDIEQAETFRQELLRHPGVVEVSLASMWPTRPLITTVPLRPEGTPEEAAITTAYYDVDEHYLATLGLELIVGRGFKGAADSTALLVNESTVRAYGWSEPLGKQIFQNESDTRVGTVVGVVRDFHARSLVEPIEPVVLAPDWRRARQPIVRITGADRAAALASIERTWERMLPDRAFGYTFLDQAYEAFYQAERTLSRTLGLFALLALFVACLGLFGLAAFTAQQRTKEIGIRKVLGATVPSITGLLTADFFVLVALAFAVAGPATYFIMAAWLEQFAYRIDLGPGVFLLAGALALAIALLTVGYQAVKAALAEPVESLRYE